MEYYKLNNYCELRTSILKTYTMWMDCVISGFLVFICLFVSLCIPIYLWWLGTLLIPQHELLFNSLLVLFLFLSKTLDGYDNTLKNL